MSTGANFLEMRRANHHIFDNTPSIIHLEQTGRNFAMFLRPQGFGKSLLIDMLKHYHGVAFADSLEEAFEVFSSIHPWIDYDADTNTGITHFK